MIEQRVILRILALRFLMKKIIIFSLLLFFCNTAIFAKQHTINLIVAYKKVNFAGKTRTALAINNQIPAPTLHFKQGDRININVTNLLQEPTALHWHGLLIPWQMDGVEGVTQKGIPPGKTFHYQFILHQSGTYWYHAHAGLQEQEGLYGAFIIDPLQHPGYHYNKNFEIVLSDWSNTGANQILSNLKKQGEYYSPRFPLQASLLKFITDYRKASPAERKLLIDDYKMMQQSRMGLYDISDVAYDSFLLNGHEKKFPWNTLVNVGDTVRLRFIGAGGSTIFRVKIPGTTMQIVHVQGNDVVPYAVENFIIAPGETTDVLVNINERKPYIIYAESLDTLGAAYGALLTSANQFVDYNAVAKFPEPQPVMRQMMANQMAQMENDKPMSHDMHKGHNMPMTDDKHMSHNMSMSHDQPSHNQSMSHNMSTSHDNSMSHNKNNMSHSMATEPTIFHDELSPPSNYIKTVGTKYQNLQAAVVSNDSSKAIYKVIKMELFGYMGQYIWFINGEPEYRAHPIILKPNKRYRFIFTNTSMMRHPMHIHGHWFILRNGHSDYDPLLHTLDIPPGATVTADLDTDASGQWFFHCHLLYHMFTGMSRVFQYSTLLELTKHEISPEDIIQKTDYHNRPIVRVDEVRPLDYELIKHPMAHPDGIWTATFLNVGEDPAHKVLQIDYTGLYGPDYNKLLLEMVDAEVQKGVIENADLDIFYWHLISQFWAIKGGVNYFYRPALTPYWQPGVGIEGLMPYFIGTNLRGYYKSGSFKVDLELSRDTQITNNFFITLGIRTIVATKTVTQAQLGHGLNQMRYMIRPYYRIIPGLNIFAEYEHQKYFGAFKNLQRNLNEKTSENTLTFGLAVLF